MAADPSSAVAEVLFVLVRGTDPEIYGGENSTLITAAAVGERNYSPSFLVTSDDALARAVADHGFPCEVVPVLNPFTGLRRASWRGRLQKLGDIWRVNRAVAARKPKIVHAAMMTGFFSSWLGARLAGAKTVLHVRGASRDQRTRWFEELAILLADQTIAVSGSLRDQLLGTGHNWLRPHLERRVQVVHNGFDFEEMDAFISQTSRETCRAITGPSSDRVSLMLVGGIRPGKGQLCFIEQVLAPLVRRVPSVCLSLVGGVQDAAYAQACNDAVDRLGLHDHVTFVGYLSRRDLYGFYLGADIAVSASEREGLPRAGLEAAAFGLPLVATSVVGNVDVVRDGETGHLVDRSKLEHMIDLLETLARDPSLRASMGRAAATRARKLYSLAQNVDGIVCVYERLLDRGRLSSSADTTAL